MLLQYTRLSHALSTASESAHPPQRHQHRHTHTHTREEGRGEEAHARATDKAAECEADDVSTPLSVTKQNVDGRPERCLGDHEKL